jgi:hypothetical protein
MLKIITTIVVTLALIIGGVVPTSHGQGRERTGRVEQGLVNGQVPSAIFQEDYGLLSLVAAEPPPSRNVSTCSASLLTNDWVITAAHCVSRYNIANPNTVTLSGKWTKPQQRKGAEIITYGNAPNWDPWDIAIIRVDFRFTNGDSDDGFHQRVWFDGPYDPNLLSTRIEIVGRGINQFAFGAGDSATPSQNDGQYRYGTTEIKSTGDNHYWYGNSDGQMIAGGDSGGASFARVYGGRALTGVHSKCSVECVPGKMCGSQQSAPPGYNPWQWVAATTECGDAPIQPLWPQIQQVIAANHSPSEPLGPDNPTGAFDDSKACNPLVYVPAPDAPGNRISRAWGDRGFWDQDRINVRIQESQAGSGLFDVVIRESNPPNVIDFSAQRQPLSETPTFQYVEPIYLITPTTVPNSGKINASNRVRIGSPAPIAPPRNPGGSTATGQGPVASRTAPSGNVKIVSRYDRTVGISLANGARLEVDIQCDEQHTPRIYQVRYLRFREGGERVVDVMLKPSQAPAR